MREVEKGQWRGKCPEIVGALLSRMVQVLLCGSQTPHERSQLKIGTVFIPLRASKQGKDYFPGNNHSVQEPPTLERGSAILHQVGIRLRGL